MAHLFGQLCCTFCFPPCPSSIVNKLAFHPPEPTYKIVPLENNKFTIRMNELVNELFPIDSTQSIEMFYERTKRGNKIVCMMINMFRSPRFTILFSHANAVDLGMMCGFHLKLARSVRCNVFSYDYSGYGLSAGKSSEKNIYTDIDAALNGLMTRYNVELNQIILYGQSIGTAPTVDLASRHKVAAVILHSPLLSALRVLFPHMKRESCFDAFPNIKKAPKIISPVLIIHGTEDETIGISQARTLHQMCPMSVKPLWIEGGGHNDLEMYVSYWRGVKQFINVVHLTSYLQSKNT